MTEWLNHIHQGNALDILRQMPSDLVNCVITSPPYWALRDYKTEPLVWDANKNCEHDWRNEITKTQDGGSRGITPQYNEERKFSSSSSTCIKCPAWRGSLGLEPTFELYLWHLIQIFDEVKRVLRKDGTCWVNLGDPYAGSQSINSSIKTTNQINAHQTEAYRKIAINKDIKGIPPKSLCMIPYRFAMEMQKRRWILRNILIWHKPNCMPSPVKDRFTVDFEPVFFFSKSKKYWFEQQYETHIWANKDTRSNIKGGRKSHGKSSLGIFGIDKVSYGEQGKNKRCIWTIPTQPFSEPHFATFPKALVRPMVKAGCPEGGVIMDIFAGTGTTCKVAKELGRNFIGIELNPEYAKLANERINGFTRRDWHARRTHIPLTKTIKLTPVNKTLPTPQAHIFPQLLQLKPITPITK